MEEVKQYNILLMQLMQLLWDRIMITVLVILLQMDLMFTHLETELQIKD